jgi:hypothetical protein
MEPIATTLSALTNPAHVHEVGLPVLVSLPPYQRLVPGELVDLRIIDTKPASELH